MDKIKVLETYTGETAEGTRKSIENWIKDMQCTFEDVKLEFIDITEE